MTLEDIAAAYPRTNTLTVPEWVLGCVRRRSITFATGVEDTATRVYWVQAHTMTGDIRIHPARPRLAAGASLADPDCETLSLLASVEGGIATTAWNEPVMSWSNWIGFQPYDKYPEPGIMHRIGDCMIEFAPSGAYIEDWRFQPSAPGLLAGLHLETETDAGGREYARSGGLVIAGDHAIMSVARRDEIPAETRAQDFVRASIDPATALARVFDCTTDYLLRHDGSWTIEASTDPRREGLTAALLGRLEALDGGTRVRETLEYTPGVRSRIWRIECLEADRVFEQSTPIPPDKLAWLNAEADTLLEPLQAHTKKKKVA